MSPNNKTITDMASAAEEFNTFFVGVGPGLAGEIPNTSISDGVESKDIYNNNNNAFYFIKAPFRSLKDTVHHTQ